jgi:hypothetical protein
LAEPAIEMGSLRYRFERADEQFAVFELPDEMCVGRRTPASASVTIHPDMISSIVTIGDSVN